MTDYPLHTTGDAKSVPFYLYDPKRCALWVHVRDDEERAKVMRQCFQSFWIVLEGLPIYYVVAVRPFVSAAKRDRLRALIKPTQSADDITFLGQLFGYTETEISWYKKQSSS